MKKIFSILLFAIFITAFSYPQNINFTIIEQDSLTPISPYIYGTNQMLLGGENWTTRRLGGDRLTGYNWENNASNAGSDYLQESDDYLTYIMGISVENENIPGIVATSFHDESLQLGAQSLITLQMAGYVARDKGGIVTLAETAPSWRWAQVLNTGDSLSLQPDTSDSYVYMDQYVNYLINKYGTANTSTGIMAYELDNEPSLWPSTHPRIHPNSTRCTEIVDKAIALDTVVKKLDPYAEIFGPALYGMNAYISFQSAPDWTTVSKGTLYSWFIDYYLDQMKKAGASAGKRLLDVLDIHYYASACGDPSRDTTVTTGNANSFADDTARINSTRTLWDSPHHYTENSWIGQYEQSFLPLIPRLFTSINKYYPGTKLAFTEYNYGGENDITGAIAESDILGIFAKYGVYFGSFWALQDSSTYISAAFKLYRNYDGRNSTFGDLYVPSWSNDSVDCSIYGSANSSNNEIHLITINKSPNKNFTGNFSITSKRKITSGQVWILNANSNAIQGTKSIDTVFNNSFTYSLPPWTVCHIVLQTSAVTSVAENNNIPVKYELKAFPNPFNPSCNIEYSVPGNSISKLEIYSIQGLLIKTFDQLINSGILRWDGTNNRNQKAASGIYFAVLRNGGRIIAKDKLVLLK